VGLFATVVYVPSANVTLLAQAQPFPQKAVEIQAQPGKAPIRVRAVTITRSESQGFKTTGSIRVLLAPAIGIVVYTNDINPPNCPGPNCGSPGLLINYGQRLMNTNGIEFAQTSRSLVVPWNGTAQARVMATTQGSAGNVGSATITVIEGNTYDKLSVTNPQATGNGADASTTPIETVADFDAARAVLEQ